MVVSRLKVNSRDTVLELPWRISRGASAPGGVAVAVRFGYENSLARP